MLCMLGMIMATASPGYGSTDQEKTVLTVGNWDDVLIPVIIDNTDSNIGIEIVTINRTEYTFIAIHNDFSYDNINLPGGYLTRDVDSYMQLKFLDLCNKLDGYMQLKFLDSCFKDHDYNINYDIPEYSSYIDEYNSGGVQFEGLFRHTKFLI